MGHTHTQTDFGVRFLDESGKFLTSESNLI